MINIEKNYKNWNHFTVYSNTSAQYLLHNSNTNVQTN